MELYFTGTRDSEKFIFPNLIKVSVRINGSLNMLYNEIIICTDLWAFVKEKKMRFFLTANKFELLIDLRSIMDRSMHGRGQAS